VNDLLEFPEFVVTMGYMAMIIAGALAVGIVI